MLLSRALHLHLLLILVASVPLALAQASSSSSSSSGMRNVDDMGPRVLAGSRRSKFSTEKTPLETLFSMRTERKENLQTHVTEMMKQTRLQADAKRKVQEEMEKRNGGSHPPPGAL